MARAQRGRDEAAAAWPGEAELCAEARRSSKAAHLYVKMLRMTRFISANSEANGGSEDVEHEKR